MSALKSLLSVASAILVLIFNSAGVAIAGQPNHALLTSVLKAHVSKGLVDYRALKSDHRLPAYLREIQASETSALKGAEEMAFWINAYNAFTLKVVCDNYPIKSIMDIESGQVWKKYSFKIDGKTYTLEMIENSILRKMGDARIHFALVCAAMSCPPLRSEAYTAARLDFQLTDQAKTFLSNTAVNSFNAITKRATLSKLFEWYASDFGASSKGILTYVGKYAPEPVARSLVVDSKMWVFAFTEYNWALNSQ